MNWKEIREKYPKGFDLLLSWVSIPNDLSDIARFNKFTESHFNNRNLYDFFDENEIYVNISVKQALNNSAWFLVYVWSHKSDWHLEPDVRTRKEAETSAFTKAFEILEVNLTQ